MKKILIFVDWFVPAYKAGGPVRSVYNLAQALSKEAEVFVVCGDRDLNETHSLPGILLNAWTKTDGINVYYATPEQRNKKLLAKLEESIKPDLIYINGLFSLYFSFLTAVTFRNSNCRVVLAPRGMLGEGALAIKSLRKKLFISAWKHFYRLHKKLEIQATSESEANDIYKILGRKIDLSVVPNISINQNSDFTIRKKIVPDEFKIVFYSRISRKKNLHFAFDVLKKLKTERSVYFEVIGPPEDLEYFELCKKAAKDLPSNIQVNFAGAIHPDDAQKRLSEFDVFFLPTLNENHGHVIFEALSAGLILLISDQTPFVNLEKEGIGFSLPLNNPNAFVQAIEQLIQMNEDRHVIYLKSIENYYRMKCNAENAILANVKYFLHNE